jgi:adenosylmethionine-8-amino-7-oxononanoate aminotransferase
MTEWDTEELVAADKKFVWHPFTNMRNGYHGDTAGAATLGAAALLQIGPSHWNFPAIQVPSLKALEQISAAEVAKIASVVCGQTKMKS